MCVYMCVCGGGLGVDAMFIIMDLCFIYEQNFKRIILECSASSFSSG